jgi:hypothetical protein
MLGEKIDHAFTQMNGILCRVDHERNDFSPLDGLSA